MANAIRKSIFSLIIMAVAIAVGVWFFSNPETANKRGEKKVRALLVDIDTPEYGNYTAQIQAMGQVVPALEVTLKSLVAGEILAMNKEFLPGGIVNKGDVLLNIDSESYEINLQRQEAVHRQSKADYALELGQQSVAKDELKILARSIGKEIKNPSLALRAPQLEQAKAAQKIALADVNAAKLEVKRTRITAPFNAIITERFVVQGDKISTADSLATLVNTDAYWVELSVPIDDLRWLDIPRGKQSKASSATVKMDGNRGEYKGEVLKLAGSLDSQSRLATLLIKVDDPIGINTKSTDATPKLPLTLADYVTVILDGKSMENVIRIPLSWLRDGNIVWVNENGKLAFKKIEAIHSDLNYLYVSEGLNAQDAIVTSHITVPVEGMDLRIAEATDSNRQSDASAGEAR